jgi:hypothetical protein
MSSRLLFGAGFLFSSLAFVAANIWSYVVVKPNGDWSAPFGFPLPLGEYGGFCCYMSIYLSGFVADAVIGLVASAITGWAFARALPRIIALAGDVARWHTRTRLD